MKITLDNLDHDDGMALVMAANPAEARHDQTIMGCYWEIDGDDFAYAIVEATPDLVARLEAEGYEVDANNYCAPDVRRR